MKHSLLFIILAFICNCQTSLAQSPKKVAVYVTDSNIDDSYKKVFGATMVEYITRSNDFLAIERTADFLAALNSEYDYQTSGEVSDAQIVKLGQQFGAKYVAVVDVNEVLDKLFVSARMIDTQTAQIASAYRTSGLVESADQLISLANNVADGLILAPRRQLEAQRQAEQARLESERRAEMERQAAYERNRQEAMRIEQAQKQAQLRSQAINNLMPDGAIWLGEYIVLRHPVHVQYSIDSQTGKPYLDIKIPAGFRIALAAEIYRMYQSNKSYFDGCHRMVLSDIIRPMKEKFNKNKGYGWWQTSTCFRDGSLGYTMRVVDTLKRGNQYYIDRQQDNLYCVLYRDGFSEAEIQAEMNRISNRY